MSSPIHSFLFSPPPSPPRRRSSIEHDAVRGFDSFRTLLLPLHDDSESDEKLRSPSSLLASPGSVEAARLRAVRPSHPVATRRARPVLEVRTVHDKAQLAAIAKAATSPIPIILEPTNDDVSSKLALETVPTRTLLPIAIPRPILRLLVFASLLLSCGALLYLVPGTRPPSLHQASQVHRLVLNPTYTDDRHYVPPQITIGRSARPDRPAAQQELANKSYRIFSHLASQKVTVPVAPARPIPASHELLAVQAWFLQSPFNTLPAHIDAKSPIDAAAVTGYDVGPSGSSREAKWFAELENDGMGEVVIWYGMDGSNTRPLNILAAISSLSSSGKTPSLLPVATRADLPKLNTMLARLGLSTAHPIIVINNVPISVSDEKLKSLEETGELETLLAQAGWAKTEAELAQAKRHRKHPLKHAKMHKRVPTELEALGLTA